MNKFVDHTNNRTNETIARLQRVKRYNKSMDNYIWVKVTNKIKLDALPGLIFFKGLLDVNLILTVRLFTQGNHFGFGYMMPKFFFQLSRSHLCIDNSEDKVYPLTKPYIQ